MSEQTLRDHSQLCEHGWLYDCQQPTEPEGCPGGREVTTTEIQWCTTHRAVYWKCFHQRKSLDGCVFVTRWLGGSDDE